VAAGRDLEAGGTWLGVSASGRFAAVTNVRERVRPVPNAPSRGGLVEEYLTSRIPVDAYAGRLVQDGSRFNGFNLLVGEVGRVLWVSNRSPEVHLPVGPGIHGVSNHLLDTPWPKVQRGREAFAAAVADVPELGDLTARLLALLDDRWLPDDRDLPDTGVGLDVERILGPMFISSDGYGTRSSSVIAFHRSGGVTFVEQTFDEGRANGEPRVVEFAATVI